MNFSLSHTCIIVIFISSMFLLEWKESQLLINLLLKQLCEGNSLRVEEIKSIKRNKSFKVKRFVCVCEHERKIKTIHPLLSTQVPQLISLRSAEDKTENELQFIFSPETVVLYLIGIWGTRKTNIKKTQIGNWWNEMNKRGKKKRRKDDKIIYMKHSLCTNNVID